MSTAEGLLKYLNEILEKAPNVKNRKYHSEVRLIFEICPTEDICEAVFYILNRFMFIEIKKGTKMIIINNLGLEQGKFAESDIPKIQEYYDEWNDENKNRVNKEPDKPITPGDEIDIASKLI